MRFRLSMFTPLLRFFSTKSTPSGRSSVFFTTECRPNGMWSRSGCVLMYSRRSSLNSLRPRSMMDIPPDMSSRSTTSVCNFLSCSRRYSRSPFSSGLIGVSSPVEVRTDIFILVSTRAFRLMYSSSVRSGQKFTSWICLFLLPIRSIRPNRWIIRTGFQ